MYRPEGRKRIKKKKEEEEKQIPFPPLLNDVPIDIGREYLKNLRYKHAVRLCTVNQRFAKICRSPQGREMMRLKEARECFIMFAASAINKMWGGKTPYLVGGGVEPQTLSFVGRMVYGGREHVINSYEDMARALIAYPELSIRKDCRAFYSRQDADSLTLATIMTSSNMLEREEYLPVVDLIGISNFHMAPPQVGWGPEVTFVRTLSWNRWKKYWRRGMSGRFKVFSLIYEDSWSPEE